MGGPVSDWSHGWSSLMRPRHSYGRVSLIPDRTHGMGDPGFGLGQWVVLISES